MRFFKFLDDFIKGWVIGFLMGLMGLMGCLAIFGSESGTLNDHVGSQILNGIVYYIIIDSIATDSLHKVEWRHK